MRKLVPIVLCISLFSVCADAAVSDEMRAKTLELLQTQYQVAQRWSNYNKMWDIAFKAGIAIVSGLIAVVTALIGYVKDEKWNGRWKVTNFILAGLLAGVTGFTSSGYDFAARRDTWQMKATRLGNCMFAVADAGRKDAYEVPMRMILEWDDDTKADKSVSCATTAK